MRKLLMVILKLLSAIELIKDTEEDGLDLNSGAFLGLLTAICAYAAESESNLSELLTHNMKYGMWVQAKFSGETQKTASKLDELINMMRGGKA